MENIIKMDNFELNATIYIILKILVILGALNWGLIALDKKFNVVELFSNLFPLEYHEFIEKFIYTIIFLSAVYVMIQRKTYLPFLDASFVPINKYLSESKKKDIEFEVIINAKGGDKVIYWAANKGNKDDKTIKHYLKAYGEYENSGISLVGKDGNAKLYVKCPQKYYVQFKKIIPKHIHYRVIYKDKMGSVKTINLNC